MTEERLSRITEDAGKTIKRVVESSAQRVTDSLEHTMKYSPIRIVSRILPNVTGVGLITTSVELNQKNHHAIAKVCFWTGSITLATNLANGYIITKK